MNDRGQTIVDLAKELLESDIFSAPPASHTHPTLPSLARTAFFAALLASMGSAGVTHMVDMSRRPLNRMERIELEALLHYAHNTAKLDKSTLQREVMTALNRTSWDELTHADYIKARDHLYEKL